MFGRVCWWEEPGSDENIWKELGEDAGDNNGDDVIPSTAIYLTTDSNLVYNQDMELFMLNTEVSQISGGVHSKYDVEIIVAKVYIGERCIYDTEISGSNFFMLKHTMCLSMCQEQVVMYLKLGTEKYKL